MLSGGDINIVGRFLMGFSSAQQQRDDVIWMPLANQEFEEREVSKYKNKWT